MFCGLQKLYEMTNGYQLTEEECAKINHALSELDPSKVPPEQVDNVVSYLDPQFLFSQVDPIVGERLEKNSSAHYAGMTETRTGDLSMRYAAISMGFALVLSGCATASQPVALYPISSNPTMSAQQAIAVCEPRASLAASQMSVSGTQQPNGYCPPGSPCGIQASANALSNSLLAGQARKDALRMCLAEAGWAVGAAAHPSALRASPMAATQDSIISYQLPACAWVKDETLGVKTGRTHPHGTKLIAQGLAKECRSGVWVELEPYEPRRGIPSSEALERG